MSSLTPVYNIEDLFNPMDAVLCYIDHDYGHAYFTTLPLNKQWGDDWNDAPYEHNAGTPYNPCWHNEPAKRHSPHRGNIPAGSICKCPSCLRDWTEEGLPRFAVFKICYESSLATPAQIASGNSPWSVQAINEGGTPWLMGSTPIFAGTPMRVFISIIEDTGGRIYLPRKWSDG